MVIHSIHINADATNYTCMFWGKIQEYMDHTQVHGSWNIIPLAVPSSPLFTKMHHSRSSQPRRTGPPPSPPSPSRKHWRPSTCGRWVPHSPLHKRPHTNPAPHAHAGSAHANTGPHACTAMVTGWRVRHGGTKQAGGGTPPRRGEEGRWAVRMHGLEERRGRMLQITDRGGNG